jgi:TolB protein
VWSPDGTRLAYVSEQDGNREIYVLRVDEQGPVGEPLKITDSPADDFAPEWSPDSRRIAFISDRNGNRDIFTVSNEGEDLQPMTRNEIEEQDLVWGPGGEIVFESRPSDNSELFVASVDGGQARLSPAEGAASQPDW